EQEIEEAARGLGFQSLWESSVQMLNSGLTTYEEVVRVLGREELPSPTSERPMQTELSLAQSRPESAEKSPIEKRKVLLVEDDDDIRSVFAMFLKTHLYDVREAINGLDALEKVYESRPDLIVCDLMMPQLDGMEFVRRLRNDSRISKIPVLILTAANSDENQVNCLQFGADDFVSKTSDSKVLLARIEKLCQKLQV
ncbi:MAG: response regulator, partial [SAR324 cluster bacterium]|nr:response regulator [SAR324 cluster bacterium]